MNRADPAASHVLDRVLVLEMVRVTEAAAIAASKLIGRGDEKAADAAAVEAMRAALNELPIDGTVVIGEGERDEAPMLYIGEKVGSAQGSGPKIDIALDPLEGTTHHRQGRRQRAGGARDRREGLPAQRARRLYGQARGRPRLSRRHDRPQPSSPAENVRAIAEAKGVDPSEIIACVLDRAAPRGDHRRAARARLRHQADPRRRRRRRDRDHRSRDRHRRLYGLGRRARGRAGRGGAALRRRPDPGPPAVPQRRRERPRRTAGASTISTASTRCEDMAKGDCIFAATGVTDGSLLKGVTAPQELRDAPKAS